MSFAIFDCITGEWLESYVSFSECEWNSEKEPEKLALFNTREEAEIVVKALNESFIFHGDQVDFVIFPVVRVQRYVRLDEYARSEDVCR